MKSLESKVKEASAKWRRRQQYRAEFIKRNPEFQKLKKEIIAEVPNILFSGPFKPHSDQSIQILHKNISMEQLTGWSKILELGKRLFPDDAAKGASMIIQFALRNTLEDLEEILAQEGLPTLSGIEVVLSAGNEIIGTHPVEYFESDIFRLSAKNKSLKRWIGDHGFSEYNKGALPRTDTAGAEDEDDYEAEEDARAERKGHLRHLLRTGNTLALDGVDAKDRTILVKIRLNRNKEDLQQDLNYLLNLLELEVEKLNLNFVFPKVRKSRWDKETSKKDAYEKYLHVYDLKKDNPNLEWSEIAKEVFPNEVEDNIPAHRKARKTQMPSRTAIDKVRYYWRMANEMINQGAWKRI